MDEQKPEEAEGRASLTEAEQPLEEAGYQGQASSQPTEVSQYQTESAPGAAKESLIPEEVRPQVLGSAQPPEEKAGGMAIAAMVVGIAGILCSWVIVFSFPLGVTALILGIIEFKRIKEGVTSEKGRGMAITGIILGSLTLFGVIIYIIVIAVTAISFATGMSALIPSLIEQFGTFY